MSCRHVIPCQSTRKTQLGLPCLALSSPCSCLPTPYPCQYAFMKVRARKKSQVPEVARERGWKDKGAWKEGCSGGGGGIVTAKTTAATRTNWDRGVGNKDNSSRILHTKLLPECRASSFQVLELPSEIHIRTQHDREKQQATRMASTCFSANELVVVTKICRSGSRCHHILSVLPLSTW